MHKKLNTCKRMSSFIVFLKIVLVLFTHRHLSMMCGVKMAQIHRTRNKFLKKCCEYFPPIYLVILYEIE